MMEIRFVVVLKAIARSEAIYRACGPLIRAPELGIQPLSQYDVKILYKKGLENGRADALSRRADYK